MSNCYICGGFIQTPRIDPRDNKLRPCGTCEHIIAESLEEYPDESESLEDFLAKQKDTEENAT